jgi:cytochrome c biogenesis protein CcmG/thiol:disulfide interchange protein DsbE
MDIATLRRRPFLLAVVSTLIALLVAGAAAAGVAAFTSDDDGRAVEANLKLSGSDRDVEPVVEGDPAGDPFPTKQLPKLTGGLGSMRDYAGASVVVNFFASYCVPCIKEMPALEQVHDDLGGQVRFVGIDVRDSQKDAAAFVERTGVTYDVLRDPSGTVAVEVGVINLPATFVLDKEGRVLAAHAGPIDEAGLRRLLATHLSIS